MCCSFVHLFIHSIDILKCFITLGEHEGVMIFIDKLLCCNTHIYYQSVCDTEANDMGFELKTLCLESQFQWLSCVTLETATNSAWPQYTYLWTEDTVNIYLAGYLTEISDQMHIECCAVSSWAYVTHSHFIFTVTLESGCDCITIVYREDNGGRFIT